MKSLRKSILTLLALTLFGGAGAWAQGPTTVFEVDFSSYTATATTGSMRIGNNIFTPCTTSIHNNADEINVIQLGANYNYSNNRYFSIKPETGSFQTGDTLLIAVCYNNSAQKTAAADIYAANGTTKLFTTAPGINGRTESGDPVVEKFVLEQDADSLLIGGSSSSNTLYTYVTTLKVLRPAAQAIELTKAGANQWTLAETPDYDLELQVEYYEAHALKNIPAGWTVKINGVPQQPPYQGDSLMITETDSVTLVPAGNPRRVKSVTLEDEGPATVLGGALVDGAIIKVYFKWEGGNAGDYVQGVYNAESGTFTKSKGGNNWASQGDAVYKVEKSGNNIIIGAGYYSYDMEGMVWTFNTTNDTYTTTNGSEVNADPGAFGLISVTLNGADITSQLTAQ